MFSFSGGYPSQGGVIFNANTGSNLDANQQANVLDAHRAALSDAEEGSTKLTDLVSGRHARFINNRLVEELTRSEAEPLPFPAQYSLTIPLQESGDREYTDLLAGQSVALTREMPAEDLVHTLANETNLCLKSFL